MNTEERTGAPDSPVWTVTTVLSEKPSLGVALTGIALSIVPVIIVVLIQRPDLRQALVMRGAQLSRQFCQSQADIWQTLATKSAQTYNLARL